MAGRLFPYRWARIVAWTGAALAWGTSVVAVRTATTAGTPEEGVPDPEPEQVAMTQVLDPLPAAPASGLIVLRYREAALPPPAAIIRESAIGGPAEARPSSAAPVPTPAPAPAPPAAAPAATARAAPEPAPAPQPQPQPKPKPKAKVKSGGS